LYLQIAHRLIPEMAAKNSVMAFILENFLGKGPGSKLWRLRQQQKLAYNVDCRVTEMEKGGGFKSPLNFISLRYLSYLELDM